LSVALSIVLFMTEDAAGPPGHARYGAGLAVLVVATGAEPFPVADALPAARPGDVATEGGSDAARPVVLVDSSASGRVPNVPGATVLRLGEDVGRGAAVNRAVATLPLEVGLVAVAPPRLVWAAGALDALRAAAARHPRAGILAPRGCDSHGAVLPSTHPVPPAGRGVLAVLGRRPWPPAGAADPAVEGVVGWSSAPGLLLRRAALDSVDGFDPRYPGRLDDLDLAQRLAAAGWLAVHVPSAVVVYAPAARPDPPAARRYLADRTSRPVRALLRATAT
jgi:N-acetylglucosaminyl-diphospho-decaprenol L-rhamnosyltransferase